MQQGVHASAHQVLDLGVVALADEHKGRSPVLQVAGQQLRHSVRRKPELAQSRTALGLIQVEEDDACLEVLALAQELFPAREAPQLEGGMRELSEKPGMMAVQRVHG